MSLYLLGRGGQEGELSVAQELVLGISDEALELRDIWEQSCQQAQLNEDERATSRRLLEEVAKVLGYLGLRDARLVERPERTEAMRAATGKKLDKQLKVAHRARGLYDHILVGPETPMPLPDVEGLLGAGGRTMPVHMRRGHLRHYWTGKGRTVLRAKFIKPVLVNAHRLKVGEEPPAPRNLDLR